MKSRWTVILNHEKWLRYRAAHPGMLPYVPEQYPCLVMLLVREHVEPLFVYKQEAGILDLYPIDGASYNYNYPLPEVQS